MRSITESADERCVRLAEYVIEKGATVRSTAAVFGVSKSTVHKDLSCRLAYVNQTLYERVGRVLAKNKAERHIRGGEATREKYLSSGKKTIRKSEL